MLFGDIGGFIKKDIGGQATLEAYPSSGVGENIPKKGTSNTLYVKYMSGNRIRCASGPVCSPILLHTLGI